jgi:DNA (cytosine-5)-methyltransferase 1
MGWKPVGFSEIEKFPSQVLAHHYPSVTNFGDMTKYKEWDINDTVGLLVGGTPCQSFSVAGLRKGLEDPRGNLALTYVGILDKFRPKWFIWENVPGVLSSGGGRDFGSFLGAVAECGYGFAYRVLDAQYFGVAQRRRRVFVVGHLGDWRPPAQVLFESESLRRDTPKGRKKGETITTFATPSVANCLQTTCNDYSRADGFNMICTEHTGPLTARDHKGISSDDCNPTMMKLVAYENHPSDSRVREMGEVCQTVTSTWGSGGGNIPFVQNIAYEWHNQDSRIKPIQVAATLNCNASGKEGHLIQEVFRKSRRAQSADDFETWINDGKANTLNTFDLGDIRTTHAVATAFGWQNSASQSMSVDTITPTLDKSKTPAVVYSFDSLASNSMKSKNPLSGCRQVELSKTIDTTYPCPSKNQGGIGIMQSMAVRRLTPVECERLQGFPDNYTNIRENCPDGPRYKAMGNSMAVPVMRWIGERINRLEHGSTR